MGKYIIEVGDAYTKHICGKGDMLCLPVRINEFEDDWLNTNIPLTPYTEPDIEKVREEAYRQGYDTGYGTKVNEFYEQGLSDAWEAARKIIHMPEGDLLNIFTECYSAVCTSVQVFLKYDASEAIEKIRQYEQEKEQEEQESITAEDVMRQYLDNFCRGRSCTGCLLHTPDFTCGRGNYFLYGMSNEEVRRAYAAVLAKMKEES